MKILNRKNSYLLPGLLAGSLLAACGTNLGPASKQMPSSVIEKQAVNTSEQAVADLTTIQPTTTSPMQPQAQPEIRLHKAEVEKLAEQKAHKQQLAAQKKQKASLSRQQQLPNISQATQYQFKTQLNQLYPKIQDNEKYAHYEANRVIQTIIEPISTFSIDVDTGSYSNLRRLINSGHLPVRDAIRTEEMINYFTYQQNQQHTDQPFTVTTEVGPSPWSDKRHLLKVSIDAVDIEQQKLPAANLVFLLDVSGSMHSAEKLGLLKKSLSLLVSKLRQQDSIAIVVYAGASGVVLEPTSGNQQQTILRALNKLRAGGSTNGGAGIRLAYQIAQQAFIKGGINRILLATDGDFNVGTVNFQQLLELVKEKRKTGISLSTIGFGTGNYNDHLMEQIADAANGKYSYIDNLNEAQKVLVDEMSSSLKTVAKDGKIQIEFNPETVAEYRLIGYENRKLNKEDFNNDKVDAGDIGAGDSVTALYEISLHGQESNQIDARRYQQPDTTESVDANKHELAFVKIRYKNPTENHSRLITQIVSKQEVKNHLADSSNDFRFSASVAAFAELLKGGQYQQDFDFKELIKLSSASKGNDAFGYRHEFIQLVRLAASLKQQANQATLH